MKTLEDLVDMIEVMDDLTKAPHTFKRLPTGEIIVKADIGFAKMFNIEKEKRR